MPHVILLPYFLLGHLLAHPATHAPNTLAEKPGHTSMQDWSSSPGQDPPPRLFLLPPLPPPPLLLPPPFCLLGWAFGFALLGLPLCDRGVFLDGAAFLPPPFFFPPPFLFPPFLFPPEAALVPPVGAFLPPPPPPPLLPPPASAVLLRGPPNGPGHPSQPSRVSRISPSHLGYGSHVPSEVQDERMSGPVRQSNSHRPPGLSREQYPGIPGHRPGTCCSCPGSCSMHLGMSVHVPSS